MGMGLKYKDCYALALLVVVLVCTTYADGAKIGVSYGMNSDSLPSPNDVVNLLLLNNIGKVRLYATNQDALQALQNSGMEVIVGISNVELQTIADDQEVANSWVTDNIKPFYPSVNIKYITVGNEVSADSKYNSYLLPAMKNIQMALSNVNLEKNIKVSTPHVTSVLNNSYPPSQGTFGETEQMSGILKFLTNNESPFMANIYPYFSYKGNSDSISADYALFRSTNTVMTDGLLEYKNLFDSMVDAFISAMEKLGYPNIPIVVTESGWPSAGSDVATVDNALAYNNNLIKHVLSNAGTPKRPVTTMETYIYSLFNENQKTGAEEERHFGLFETNKTPVYPLLSSPESFGDLKVVLIYLTII